MAEAATKLPVKSETSAASASVGNRTSPFETLRREIDRLFDDLHPFGWRLPSTRSMFEFEAPRLRAEWPIAPAMDLVDNKDEYEITAELPGIDEKNVEIKLSDRTLTIKGEKQEDKEEKENNYYRRERLFGSFERSFRIPESVDADKIEASFKKGELTVTLPKKPKAQKPAKKINVKSA